MPAILVPIFGCQICQLWTDFWSISGFQIWDHFWPQKWNLEFSSLLKIYFDPENGSVFGSKNKSIFGSKNWNPKFNIFGSTSGPKMGRLSWNPKKKTEISTQSWTLKWIFLRYRNWSLALAPEQLQATKVLQKINFKSQALLKDTGGERTPAWVEFPRQLKSTTRARRSCKKFYLKIYVKAQLDSGGNAKGEGFDHRIWTLLLDTWNYCFLRLLQWRCRHGPQRWAMILVTSSGPDTYPGALKTSEGDRFSIHFQSPYLSTETSL